MNQEKAGQYHYLIDERNPTAGKDLRRDEPRSKSRTINKKSRIISISHEGKENRSQMVASGCGSYQGISTWKEKSEGQKLAHP